jgi:hypothetical protein
MTSSAPMEARHAIEREQQRRHDRYVVEIPGLLQLEQVRGGIYAITVLDVSTAGLRITCPKAVLAETRVEVKCQKMKIFGTVRYAREVGYEFHLGIEADRVDDGKSKSEEVDLLALFPAGTARLRRM